MAQFVKTLRSSEAKKVEKPVVKTVVKEVEKVVYQKSPLVAEITKKVNNFEIIMIKKPPDLSINSNNMTIIPKRKIFNPLGKHVYIRLRQPPNKVYNQFKQRKEQMIT